MIVYDELDDIKVTRKSTPAKKGLGGAREGAGRKKGSKNPKTIAWEELGKFITESGAQRAVEILLDPDTDDETFMKFYTLLLEYFKPKLARQELTAKDGAELKTQQITINNLDKDTLQKMSPKEVITLLNQLSTKE